MIKDCVIALDLGTTAFKCAPVDEMGLLAEPIVAGYDLDYEDGNVTFEPGRYVDLAETALRGGVRAAHAAGYTVRSIGISSQAQTYIPLDRSGLPLQKAIVWTDGRAVDEAGEVATLIPDFVHHSGFKKPLPELFMLKVRHFARSSGIPLRDVWKFTLLNEFIIFSLTGQVYGDTTNQGMSGFYHITRREWSQAALSYAGISPAQLAEVAPAASLTYPLSPLWRTRLELGAVPVYSCGNDQSCAAAGAGLASTGDFLCNFGTAMVIYALKDNLPDALLDKQIAGISPITGGFFLLGVEDECGNVLEWAHRVCYSGEPFATMMEQALSTPVDPQSLPRVIFPGGGRIQIEGLTVGHERWQVVRALLERYSDTFGVLLAGVRGERNLPVTPTHQFFAAGGISRSAIWLRTLSERFGVQFHRTATEQPGLVGVARIIQHRIKP